MCPKKKQWSGSEAECSCLKKKHKAFIKYIDQNNLVEIKLLEVLRSMKAIQNNQLSRGNFLIMKTKFC